MDSTDASVLTRIAEVVFEHFDRQRLVLFGGLADCGDRIVGRSNLQRVLVEHRLFVACFGDLYVVGRRFEFEVVADIAEGDVFEDRLAVDIDVDVRSIRRQVGNADASHLGFFVHPIVGGIALAVVHIRLVTIAVLFLASGTACETTDYRNTAYRLHYRSSVVCRHMIQNYKRVAYI